MIKTHSNEGDNQPDYDDILNKVKLVYSGKGNEEINKMKLSIAVDYL
jgi:hypothetical protein